MRPLVKRIDMALHIQQLCADHGITVTYQSLDDAVPHYYASPSQRHIHIRPTKNTGYYVSALHEIGHIMGDNQSYNNTVKEREIGAWIWAMLNAKFGQIRRIVSCRGLYRLMVLMKRKVGDPTRWNPVTGMMKNKSQFNKIFMKNLISHINNVTPTRELSLFEKIYVKVVKLCRR